MNVLGKVTVHWDLATLAEGMKICSAAAPFRITGDLMLNVKNSKPEEAQKGFGVEIDGSIVIGEGFGTKVVVGLEVVVRFVVVVVRLDVVVVVDLGFVLVVNFELVVDFVLVGLEDLMELLVLELLFVLDTR